MENIENVVSEIAYKIKEDERIKDRKYYNSSLTGELGFDSTDLFYLFLEIMSHYKIRFSVENVEGYRFDSIHGISESIFAKCK